jgi:hypothetical protein
MEFPSQAATVSLVWPATCRFALEEAKLLPVMLFLRLVMPLVVSAREARPSSLEAAERSAAMFRFTRVLARRQVVPLTSQQVLVAVLHLADRLCCRVVGPLASAVLALLL